MRFRHFTVAAAVAISALSATGVANADTDGPDVSSWQHINGASVDWAQVRASGNQFAMLKATEGLGYVNPFFVQDSVAMRAAGVARGTYHFAHPELSPELQAVFYSALVLGQNGPLDLPPVLDLETTGGLDPADLVNWTHRYLRTVQALTGRTPIIYTYPNFWRTAMGNDPGFAQYPLWIADYSGDDSPDVPGGWNTWTIWQTTDSGSIPGIPGATDLNQFNPAAAPFDSLANLAGGFGSVTGSAVGSAAGSASGAGSSGS